VSGDLGVGDRAPDGTLVDVEGRTVALSLAWAERTALLVFLRYFGCPLCQAHVVALREDRQRFDDVGANVVLVGQGGPEDGSRFRDRKHVPFPCWLDPERRLYRAFGLVSGSPVQALGLNAVLPMMRANLHRETRQRLLSGGNLMQMPGTFVVSADGVVRFAHRNRTIADSPPNRVLLDVLEGLRRTDPA